VVTIEPLTPGQLRIYACGPTVYRPAHVGNMRAFLLADLITRVAKSEGLTTTLVQNITDVGHMNEDLEAPEDDKILAQAKLENRSPLELARAYEAAFHQDRKALNIQDANYYPRASDYIEPMIDFVNRLIEGGNAYVGDDDSVYFDARSFETYGAISGNRLSELKPGHRFNADDPTETAKRFHADWALWKHASAARTELTWESPWGRGFPGWHTECSVMSLDLLGDAIDIHTGGIDLRFPHHEDERAQSNAATNRDVVKHWVHAEHLLFEGKKMSKSSGNIVLVEDVVARGLDPLAVRLAFLEHRYRQQMDLTWQTITSAHETLRRWRELVNETTPGKEAIDELDELDELDGIRELITNDLDTQGALVRVRALEKAWRNKPSRFAQLLRALEPIFALDIERESGQSTSLPTGVSDLANRREAARAAKNWRLSDELRAEIEQQGYEVKDTPEGQKIRRK
jgi:cysteinyl-tRNA synthetase